MTLTYSYYHIPGKSLYRTCIAYSLYPISSFFNVLSSNYVRVINKIIAITDGIKPYKDPNIIGIPIAQKIAPR